jgi:hypothetical protein
VTFGTLRGAGVTHRVCGWLAVRTSAQVLQPRVLWVTDGLAANRLVWLHRQRIAVEATQPEKTL